LVCIALISASCIFSVANTMLAGSLHAVPAALHSLVTCIAPYLLLRTSTNSPGCNSRCCIRQSCGTCRFGEPVAVQVPQPPANDPCASDQTVIVSPLSGAEQRSITPYRVFLYVHTYIHVQEAMCTDTYTMCTAGSDVYGRIRMCRKR
jgi:hypothetical protein